MPDTDDGARGYAGQRIVVAGGCGFIGSHLSQALVEAGAEVTVACRHAKPLSSFEKLAGPAVRLINQDLSCVESAAVAFNGSDILFQLAGSVGGVQYNCDHPGTQFYKNATLSLGILEGARRAQVGKVVLVSSSCVYSPRARVPTKEQDGFFDMPDNSNFGYGWAKRLAEIQAQCYIAESGMNISVVRPANVYGPRDDFSDATSHVIPALIKRVFESRERVVIWGQGDQTRSFIYVKDLVRALMEVGLMDSLGQPLNIGTEEEITMRELVRIIMEIAGRDLQIEHDLSRPSGQIRKAVDITLAKELMRWRPWYTLREGLLETIVWYRTHVAKGTA